jgi:hypothetical protein
LDKVIEISLAIGPCITAIAAFSRRSSEKEVSYFSLASLVILLLNFFVSENRRMARNFARTPK